MKGLSIINLGETLINTVNSNAKTKPLENQITRIRLNTDELLKLADNDKNAGISTLNAENEYLFGRNLCGLRNWTLDISHKIKSKYEILAMSLKCDGYDVLKGAYSKAKDKRSKVKKFHFVIDDIELRTGYTKKYKEVTKSKTTDVFPEKYKDYLWRLDDRDLYILTDYFGLFDKKKPPEIIAKEWGIQIQRLKQLKNIAMWRTRDRIRGGFPALRHTEPGHYTAKDYIKALDTLENNDVYDNSYGQGHFIIEGQIIDDKYLQKVKEVRKSLKIIDEWRQTRKKEVR